MIRFVLAALLLLTLAACGVKPPDGAAVNTQPLTQSELLFIQKGCIACHTVTEGDTPEETGPSIVGVVDRTKTTLQSPDYTGDAKTVEDYFRESILQPEIYLVSDYEPLMPQTYQASLTEQEIVDLIEYLLQFE